MCVCVCVFVCESYKILKNMWDTFIESTKKKILIQKMICKNINWSLFFKLRF